MTTWDKIVSFLMVLSLRGVAGRSGICHYRIKKEKTRQHGFIRSVNKPLHIQVWVIYNFLNFFETGTRHNDLSSPFKISANVSERASEMGNRSTVSSRHTGAAVFWSEVGWQGIWWQEIWCALIRRKKKKGNRYTKSLSLHNVEPEPALWTRGKDDSDC